jgi:prepilin-type processing-associated H-X9-DG protein
MKQHGIALHNYHDTHKLVPTGYDDRGRLWSARILPFVEQQALHDTLRPEESANWDTDGSPEEIACSTVISFYRCPTMPLDEHYDYNGIALRVPGSYLGNGGTLSSADDASEINTAYGPLSFESSKLNGLFGPCGKVTFAMIKDGLSNTVAFGEAPTDPDFSKDGQGMDYWYIGSPQADPCGCNDGTGGTEFTEAVGSAAVPMNARWKNPALSGILMELSFGSYHPGGGMFCLADGSVRYLSDTIDQATYKAAFSRAGKESTQLP